MGSEGQKYEPKNIFLSFITNFVVNKGYTTSHVSLKDRKIIRMTLMSFSSFQNHKGSYPRSPITRSRGEYGGWRGRGLGMTKMYGEIPPALPPLPTSPHDGEMHSRASNAFKVLKAL